MLRAELEAGGRVGHVMPTGGRTYVAVLEGTVTAAGHRLDAADRLMVSGSGALPLSSEAGASAIIVQMLEPS